jgi:hypothetical protein
MLTELALTHICNQTVHWSAGGYFDAQGRALTHCDGCGEWLGSAFVRAEESHRPLHAAKARLQLQAS